MEKLHKPTSPIAIMGVSVTIVVLLVTPLLIIPVHAQSVTQLVDAKAKVTSDEDSGFCGYWALDHYNKQINITTTDTSGTYFVNETYEGFWQTFQGALSPNGDCNAQTPREGATASGTFEGYVAFFVSGTFSPSKPTGGNLGTYNFGGTSSDVLNLVYAHQTGDATPVEMLNFYFAAGWTTSCAGTAPLTSASGCPFSFTYHFHGQAWVDAYNVPASSSGNIVA